MVVFSDMRYAVDGLAILCNLSQYFIASTLCSTLMFIGYCMHGLCCRCDVLSDMHIIMSIWSLSYVLNSDVFYYSFVRVCMCWSMVGVARGRVQLLPGYITQDLTWD